MFIVTYPHSSSPTFRDPTLSTSRVSDQHPHTRLPIFSSYLPPLVLAFPLLPSILLAARSSSLSYPDCRAMLQFHAQTDVLGHMTVDEVRLGG
jgi:hypothetical protein